MVEFFTESKDEAVVVEEARKILQGILNEIDSTRAKKLLKLLLKSYETLYAYVRQNFRINWYNDGGGAEPRTCVEYLKYAAEAFEKATKTSVNLEQKFQNIGEGFGYFLGIIEAGIVSPNFRKFEGNPKSSFQENARVMTEKQYYTRQILEQCEKIRDLLKALKLKIDRGIIENRIKRIAKKRAAKLSLEQQQLLIDMSLVVAA